MDELQDKLSNLKDELENQKEYDKDPNSPFIKSIEKDIKNTEEEISYYYTEV